MKVQFIQICFIILNNLGLWHHSNEDKFKIKIAHCGVMHDKRSLAKHSFPHFISCEVLDANGDANTTSVSSANFFHLLNSACKNGPTSGFRSLSTQAPTL